MRDRAHAWTSDHKAVRAVYVLRGEFFCVLRILLSFTQSLSIEIKGQSSAPGTPRQSRASGLPYDRRNQCNQIRVIPPRLYLIEVTAGRPGPVLSWVGNLGWRAKVLRLYDHVISMVVGGTQFTCGYGLVNK